MPSFPKRMSLYAVCVCVWNFMRADSQCMTEIGRLVGGNTFEGRVEVCISNQWYRLCADGITNEVAEVGCRQVGFTTGVLLPSSTYSPGNPDIPFVLADIVCSGSEKDLYDCNGQSPTLDQCPSNQDTVIRCSYDYVPFLDSASFQDQSSSDLLSVYLVLYGSLPFGKTTFKKLTVSISGYILFGIGNLSDATQPALPVAGNEYLLAPLWSCVFPIPFVTSVSIGTFSTLVVSNPYLIQISNFISNKTRSNFTAEWMILAQWKNVALLNNQYGNDSERVISFQAVVLTDNVDSYALYIYKCAADLPRASGIIGFSTPSYFQQFRYSDSENSTFLGCSNQDSAGVPYFNLLYKLTDLENSSLSQNTSEFFSSAPLIKDPPTGVGGSCVAAGFNNTSCCQPFLDPTDSCRVEAGAYSCYCDKLCFKRNDCCPDINDQQVDRYIHFCVPSVNPLVEFSSVPTETAAPPIFSPSIMSNSTVLTPSIMSNSTVLGPALIVVPITTALVVTVVILIVFITVVVYKKKKKRMFLPNMAINMSEHSYKQSGFGFQNTGRSELNRPLITIRQPIPVTSEYADSFPSDLIIHKNQLRLLDSIGRGEFGIVYKAHLLDFFSTTDVTMVAVKTLKGDFDTERVDELLRESLKMKQFSHTNVMELYGVCLDAGPAPYIILPFMEGGSILRYLRTNRTTYVLPETCDSNENITQVRNNLLAMCLQIARGMEYLTSQNFVHRDLAARNCMISADGHIKVADFGLSKAIADKLYFRQDKTERVKLPLKWLALEAIEDGMFSEKTDVWSFGITSWEIFSGGKFPYAGVVPGDLLKMLTEGYRMEQPLNAACSGEIYRMIMFRCWKADPNKRPTFTQLVSDIGTTLNYMADYLDLNEMEAVQSLSVTLKRYTTGLHQS